MNVKYIESIVNIIVKDGAAFGPEALKKILDALKQLMFRLRQEEIEHKLSQSAFRRGISAFRHGLMPAGISDHLPVSVTFNLEAEPVSMMSWNLLADCHLYNNFLNISGSELLKKRIADGGNVYFSAEKNNLHHFFSELAEFYSKKKSFSLDELAWFVSLDNQPSKLARSRDPEKALLKQDEVRVSRQQIVEMISGDAALKHEFGLSIEHSVSLYQQIVDGSLAWKHRYAQLKTNKQLVAKIQSCDLLCFQECTNPEDVKNLLGERMRVISHRVGRADDYCILAYDATQYELQFEKQFGLYGKPAIAAQLQSKKTGVDLVVGSVHHPGGDQDYSADILSQIDNPELPYLVVGDYNHTNDFFVGQGVGADCCLFPGKPTMAGNDYGNVNQAIDGAMTNIRGAVIEQVIMPVLPPVNLGLPTIKPRAA